MPDDALVRSILEGGDDAQRAALHELAVVLTDQQLTSVDVLDLPGLDPAPNATARAGIASRNQSRLWRARQRLYEHALTYEQAADRLGVTDRQISNLVAAGDLLAFAGPHGKRLPAWQFHPDAARGRLDGIRQVAAAHPGRLLALSAWMVAPNQALDGRAPADALADGHVDRVVAVAAAGL